ncbi:MAG: glycosyltransferase [Pseudomonadota bacterium]
MNPLSPGVKKFLYEQCAFGRLRWIAKPVYDSILFLELCWHRFEDLFHPVNSAPVPELTIIIKTFERPYAVKRLLRSIRRRYPDVPILIVDDSRQPLSIEAEGVEVIELPYDSGISVGRNHALDIVSTKYFLLLDDDFVFSHRQQLHEYVDLMQRHDTIDIMGGRYIDLPLYTLHAFQNTPLQGTRAEPKVALGTLYDSHPVVDKVQNYFVGRTETVREVKWKPELKIMEHTEFFTRARGQLVTVFHRDMKILHAKTPFDLGYLKMRYRR